MATFNPAIFAQEPTKDLLAGPTIQDEEVTQEEMRSEHSRVTGKNNMNHQSRRLLRLWMQTLQSLDLSKEQQTEIQSLVHQLQKAKEVFQKEHEKEMQELKKKSKEAKAAGNDIPDDVGTRTRELLAMSPKPEEYQAKAWALLSEDQQINFQQKYQAALEELKKHLEKRKDKQDPMEGESRKGFGPEDPLFGDRERPTKDGPRFDRDNQEGTSNRRANFLRRLKRLQEENEQ